MSATFQEIVVKAIELTNEQARYIRRIQGARRQSLSIQE